MEIEPDATFEQIAVICSREKLKIEAYAALYIGRTRTQRLLLIHDNCHDESIQLDALKIAYDELKKGQDTRLFKYVVGKINGRLGPNYCLDVKWIDQVHRQSHQRRKELEDCLNLKKDQPYSAAYYRSTLCNDELILRYKALGDLHYARGALKDAFENYEKAEDRCSNPTEVIDISLNAILVSVDRWNPINVLRYVSKVKHMIKSMKVDHTITYAKLQCAAGLAHLMCRHYKNAAKKFVKTPEFGDSYPEVIAAQDVATYGGLCALVSFDREELKTKVIDNRNFGNFLELVPEMRELINDFYTSRYASCLDHLAEIKPNLLWDIHLHAHVEVLYSQIRKKALIQYTVPYVSLDMNLMATVFRTTVDELQKELETLITEEQIPAKIDSVNKVMYANRVNQRNSVFRQVLESGSQLERETKGMVQRFSLLKSIYNRRA